MFNGRVMLLDSGLGWAWVVSKRIFERVGLGGLALITDREGVDITETFTRIAIS